MTANHYVKTDTTAIYRYDITNPETNGIMLDVIIMDPVPDTPDAKNEYISALTKHTDLTTLPYQYSIRTGNLPILVGTGLWRVSLGLKMY